MAVNEIRNENTGVFIRTFGSFDVFVDGEVVYFSSAKEKELMALLVDLRGGTLSPARAVSLLWEDEPADSTVRQRYRRLASNLGKTLRKYKIDYIIGGNGRGVRCLLQSEVTCDYYEMLKGNAEYAYSFAERYMDEYSWGEGTLASLTSLSMKRKSAAGALFD